MSILLLDVDGTLIDSFPGIRAGFLHTLDTLGWKYPSEEFIARIPGPPMEVTLRSLGMSEEQAQEGLGIYLDYTADGGWADATALPRHARPGATLGGAGPHGGHGDVERRELRGEDPGAGGFPRPH
ncbi:HAD hydrolase-like protein [Corynebacterium suedekumii]|nr:HAD hydrolase-like protein [Corynebacterium suedekumii]